MIHFNRDSNLHSADETPVFVFSAPDCLARTCQTNCLKFATKMGLSLGIAKDRDAPEAVLCTLSHRDKGKNMGDAEKWFVQSCMQIQEHRKNILKYLQSKLQSWSGDHSGILLPRLHLCPRPDDIPLLTNYQLSYLQPM